MLHFAPLAPQTWGEPELQSPPELGSQCGLGVSPSRAPGVDLGGDIASDTNQRTCVYTSPTRRRKRNKFLADRGIQFSPFPGREGGWGVRSALSEQHWYHPPSNIQFRHILSITVVGKRWAFFPFQSWSCANKLFRRLRPSRMRLIRIHIRLEIILM